MQHKRLASFGLFLFLLVASACSGPAAQGTVAPTVTPYIVATSQLPQPTSFVSPGPTGSPLPVSQGLLLTTDRSGYQPADTVIVTIINSSSRTLYTWDTRASCSLFDLEMFTQGRWQPASVARCPLGRPARRVDIEPGRQYSANIQARAPGLTTETFPIGTYRVTLTYALTPVMQDATARAVSAPFQVQE